MLKLRIADTAVRKFQSEHEPIFTAVSKLQEARTIAENELRTAAKQIASGYETEQVSVEYVMPMHRYFDPARIRKKVDAAILSSLDVIVMEEKVDDKMLKTLVRAGKIKKSVLKECLVEEPTGSPRVTITIKDEE